MCVVGRRELCKRSTNVAECDVAAESGLEREGIYPRPNLDGGFVQECGMRGTGGGTGYIRRDVICRKEEDHHHNPAPDSTTPASLSTITRQAHPTRDISPSTANMKFSNVLLFATAALAAPAIVERQSQTTLVGTITDAANQLNATVQTSLDQISKIRSKPRSQASLTMQMPSSPASATTSAPKSPSSSRPRSSTISKPSPTR